MTARLSLIRRAVVRLPKLIALLLAGVLLGPPVQAQEEANPFEEAREIYLSVERLA